MMNSNFPSKQRLAIALSIALHAVVALVLFLAPSLTKQKLTRETPVEVELMSPEEALKALNSQPLDPMGQIVEQDQRVNDEKPKDAKFLSKHDQKVVRETQAELQGKFKNSQSNAGQPTPQQEAGKTAKEEGETRDKQDLASEEKPEPKELITSDDGPSMKRKPSLKDLMPNFRPGPPPIESKDLAQGGGSGPSASDDHLKDVQKGMQTLLSTREFVYYSYYNRIKEKLRQTWQPKIKEKMERILRQGRTIASETDKITRIVIILNDKGTLVRVQIVGASGVSDLDDAAVEAFRAAAPFPNPPKGIADQDGMIKIRWDFILEANANSFFDAVRGATRSL